MTVVVILLIRRKYRGGAELGGARQISKPDLLSPPARGEPQEGDIALETRGVSMLENCWKLLKIDNTVPLRKTMGVVVRCYLLPSQRCFGACYMSLLHLWTNQKSEDTAVTLSSNHKLCHIHDVTFQLLSCLVSVLALFLYYPMYIVICWWPQGPRA